MKDEVYLHSLEDDLDLDAVAADELAARLEEHAAAVADLSDDDEASPFVDAPPPPPHGVFPPEVEMALEEVAEVYSVPLSIAYADILALLSCCVGRRRALRIKSTWHECGNLWIVVVAPSGLGKSPIFDYVFRRVDSLQTADLARYRVDLAEYQEAYAKWQGLSAKARADAPRPKSPRPPIRYYMDETTLEGLAKKLESAPEGLMWRPDELAGMLASFDRYNPGGGREKPSGTRARLLSAYDCRSWSVSRKDESREITVPHACISIYGGIQPGVVPRAFDGADEDSGFLPRFLFIRAEWGARPPLWSDREVSLQTDALFSRLTDALLAYGMDGDLETLSLEPRCAVMSDGARQAWIEWSDRLVTEAWASDSTTYGAWAQKLRGQTGRICILLHCLDAALAGRDGTGLVSEECMRRAIALAQWLQAHQKQIQAVLKGTQGRAASPLERAVMEVVVEESARRGSEAYAFSAPDLYAAVAAKVAPTHVSATMVGRVASGKALGLPRVKKAGVRYREVTPEVVARYRAWLQKA